MQTCGFRFIYMGQFTRKMSFMYGLGGGGGGGARNTVRTPLSNIAELKEKNYESAFKIKIGLKGKKIRGIIKRGVEG